MYVSAPQKSQKYPVSLEELCNITLMAGLGLLHNWAFGNKLAYLHGHQLHIDHHGQCAGLK